MTTNDAFEMAATVAENTLRKEAEIWSGATHVGANPQKLALARKVADAIRALKSTT